MNEKPPAVEKEMTEEEASLKVESITFWLALLRKIERKEKFPFPGLEQEVYARMKADEEAVDEAV